MLCLLLDDAQGPGRYAVERSAFDVQAESDKVSGAVIGFPRARRTAEAKRFISPHHSRHHRVVMVNEPGPGMSSHMFATVSGLHPHLLCHFILS